MPTPAYGLKHWWREERRPGESLKAFARRWAGWRPVYEPPTSIPVREPTTTSAVWLHRKGASNIGPMAFDTFLDAFVMVSIVHNEELRLAGADTGQN